MEYTEKIELPSYEPSPALRAAGLVRKVDKMGRFSIPKDFRRLVGLEPGVAVEFMNAVLDGQPIIILRKAPTSLQYSPK